MKKNILILGLVVSFIPPIAHSQNAVPTYKKEFLYENQFTKFRDLINNDEVLRVSSLKVNAVGEGGPIQGDCDSKSFDEYAFPGNKFYFGNDSTILFKEQSSCKNLTFNLINVSHINWYSNTFTLTIADVDAKKKRFQKLEITDVENSVNLNAKCTFFSYRRSTLRIGSPWTHKQVVCYLYQNEKNVGSLSLHK